MKPQQYHEVLITLDRALELFDHSDGELSVEDLQLRLRLATIRSHVLMAESGHPFVLDPSTTHAGMDPDLTPAPWTKLLTSDPHQIPPEARR